MMQQPYIVTTLWGRRGDRLLCRSLEIPQSNLFSQQSHLLGTEGCFNKSMNLLGHWYKAGVRQGDPPALLCFIHGKRATAAIKISGNFKWQNSSLEQKHKYSKTMKKTQEHKKGWGGWVGDRKGFKKVMSSYVMTWQENVFTLQPTETRLPLHPV